ncbi:MAG: rRNA methyltransferase [Deltaproteobacteria bacterium]|nr:rRNA methyltransferase [Deltaproteobacteria bacterium]
MGKFNPRDTFYRKAKEDGFRARSAYKLLDIQKKYRVIRRGDAVLDLGCAPGSWLQVLSDLVGEQGLVLGIDLLPTHALPRKNVQALVADIRTVSAPELLASCSRPHFDVITCDIAPNLSGIRDVDNARITDLYQAVRDIALKVLKPDGRFIIKSFFLEDFKQTRSELENLFTRVTIYKPAASRGASAEVYLVCEERKTVISDQ